MKKLFVLSVVVGMTLVSSASFAKWTASRSNVNNCRSTLRSPALSQRQYNCRKLCALRTSKKCAKDCGFRRVTKPTKMKICIAK